MVGWLVCDGIGVSEGANEFVGKREYVGEKVVVGEIVAGVLIGLICCVASVSSSAESDKSLLPTPLRDSPLGGIFLELI